MQRRHNKIIWLVLCLVLVGQSMLPLAAMAEVSMHCTGVASANACAQLVVPVADKDAAVKSLNQMDCCKLMPGCHTMMSGNMQAMPAMPGGPVFMATGVPSCQFIISTIENPRSLAFFIARTAHVRAPVLAPVASVILDTQELTVPVLFSANVHSLSPRYLNTAHGLRAPPTA